MWLKLNYRFNPLTHGFDLIEPDNFSYSTIAVGETKTIPENQQMIVFDALTVDGELVLDGQVVILDDKIHNRIKTTSVSETIDAELYELITQDTSGITTSITPITGSVITITNRSGDDNTLNLTIQGIASPVIKDRESFSLIYNGVDYDFT